MTLEKIAMKLRTNSKSQLNWQINYKLESQKVRRKRMSSLAWTRSMRKWK